MDLCPTHGAYYKAGCKDCRARGAQKQAVQRERNGLMLKKVRGRMTSTHPRCKHGTTSGYNNYRCRCERCTEANRHR